jgi:hypothetical protein
MVSGLRNGVIRNGVIIRNGVRLVNMHEGKRSWSQFTPEAHKLVS